MSNTAAHLVDAVLPHVPYRQWVLSFPRRVRFLLAKDSALLSAVLDKALRKIFAWQRRRARSLGQVAPIAPMTGAVTFVQRFGSILNLNVHAHSLMPDGVFLRRNDGSIFFRPVPPPYKEDMSRLLLQIARATEKLIKQREEDVTAYNDIDYGGTSEAFKAGTYANADFEEIANDSISSLIVTPGMSTELCSESGGWGNCQTFKGHIPYIGLAQNDTTSYISAF